MGNEFGDTLVACVECGAVYVSEKITNDESVIESAAKSGKPFVGRSCFSCCAGAITAVASGLVEEPKKESTWRLLKGPLRVPRK